MRSSSVEALEIGTSTRGMSTRSVQSNWQGIQCAYAADEKTIAEANTERARTLVQSRIWKRDDARRTQALYLGKASNTGRLGEARTFQVLRFLTPNVEVIVVNQCRNLERCLLHLTRQSGADVFDLLRA